MFLIVAKSAEQGIQWKQRNSRRRMTRARDPDQSTEAAG